MFFSQPIGIEYLVTSQSGDKIRGNEWPQHLEYAVHYYDDVLGILLLDARF